MTQSDAFQLDAVRLTRYLEAHVPGFQGPTSVEKFSGGQSNPTFLLRAGSGRYVLRRQPPGELLKSAHAVDREFRVLKALADSSVPVPHVYHLCEDRGVIGSMFYVMSYMDGRIFWNPALPELPLCERKACYDALLRSMAVLHEVDVDAVNLSDFGRRGNYFERQISLWVKQYRAAETERQDDMEALIAWLPMACPTETDSASLVHGDFRFDNLMFSRDGCHVQGILDWELSTIGNPLADLAYFCMCLRLPAQGHIPGLAGLDRQVMGVPQEQEIVERYCTLRDIGPIRNWHFYLAFSFFRLAAIAQGVKARSLNGNASSAAATQVGNMVGPLAMQAVAIVDAQI